MTWQLATCILICVLSTIGLLRRFYAFLSSADGSCTGCHASCSNCDESSSQVHGDQVLVEIESPAWIERRN